MALEPLVYVVDDDPAMRSSLRWLIESVGLAVRTSSSAAEFYDAYDRVPSRMSGSRHPHAGNERARSASRPQDAAASRFRS